MAAKDKTEIQKLLKTLHKLDYYYWNQKPIVPDSIYDTYYLRLKKYKNKYPQNRAIQNYFRHLPQNEQNTFKQVKHTSFMGSLDKIRTVGPLTTYLNKWNQKPHDLWNTDKFVIESKLDGLSGVMYFNVYPNHPFMFLTRGGGYYGNDITPEAKYLKGMDIAKIRHRIGGRRLIVRGELIMSKADFKRFNRAHHHKYANSRNAVSGIVNSKDPRDVARAGVYLNTYTLVNRAQYRQQYPTELSQLKFLSKLGFYEDLDVHTFVNNSKGRKEVVDYCTNYTRKHRERLNFDIDGLTIKPNNTRNFIQKIGDFKAQHKLGYNHHGPVHSKAWKFAPRSAVGILEHIKWQPSANGKLSPVGVLQHPVDLFGSRIDKASLGSLPDAWKRDIRLGDHVLVRKMNDVIPKLFSIPKLRTGNEHKIQIPQNAKLVGKYVYLKDTSHNQAIDLQRWRKFVSKPCLNIKGLSVKMIHRLFNAKQMHAHVSLLDLDNFSSLWKLTHITVTKNVGTKNKIDIETYPIVLDLPGFGKKSYATLRHELQTAKKVPLSRVLLGLPIKDTGMSILKPIAKYISDFGRYQGHYNKWLCLRDKVLQELPKQKGFGDSSLENIKRTFSKYVYDQLCALKNVGLDLVEPVNQNTGRTSKLSGKHFVITGKLSKPRKYFQKLIEQNGGQMQSSVNSKTDDLICDRVSQSSKYRKAKKLQIPIINEKDFLKMLS